MTLLKDKYLEPYYALVVGIPLILLVSCYLYMTPYMTAGELKAAQIGQGSQYRLEAPTGAPTRCHKGKVCSRLHRER